MELRSRVLLAVLPLILLDAVPAAADFKIFAPDVDLGETSFETVGDLGFDRDRDKSGEQSYTADVEYGITRWWQTELEIDVNRAAGTARDTDFNQVTSENLFQFTEHDESWVDAGFFAEYEQSTLPGTASEALLGPILRKDFGGTATTINLFLEKELGEHAAGRALFTYAAETRLDDLAVQVGGQAELEPGFQIYGTPGAFGHFARWSAQDERAGPQLFGTITDLGRGALEWNGGVLFGLAPGVARITLRWQAEYRIHY
jgi:hypothetical protein